MGHPSSMTKPINWVRTWARLGPLPLKNKSELKIENEIKNKRKYSISISLFLFHIPLVFILSSLLLPPLWIPLSVEIQSLGLRTLPIGYNNLRCVSFLSYMRSNDDEYFNFLRRSWPIAWYGFSFICLFWACWGFLLDRIRFGCRIFNQSNAFSDGYVQLQMLFFVSESYF